MEADPLLDGYPEIDKPSCELLGPTALVVQALMGVLVILSLVYKRHRETAKRPWRIWLFDVSKQVVGQMFVHGVNVFISDFVSQATEGNACVFYFLNILIDTTIGVGMIYIILHLLTYLFSEKFNLKGFESGVYGNPPSITFWYRQAAIYVLALTSMKFIVILLLILFPGIFRIGEWLLSWTWTGDGDALQVVFTMGLFPIMMNIVQFWLIDSIVKASAVIPVALGEGTEADREPLFGVPSDDEDDGPSLGRRDLENQRPSNQSRSSSGSLAPSRTKSYSTGTTTPDEYKTGESAFDPITDQHSYPPSLSSSFASSSTMSEPQAPKEAKNLLKKSKRRNAPSPLYIPASSQPAINSPQQPLTVPVTVPRIPSPALQAKHEVLVATEPDNWTESWDDSEEWAKQIEDDVQTKLVGRDETRNLHHIQRLVV